MKKILKAAAALFLALAFLLAGALSALDVVVGNEGFLNSLYEKYESAAAVGITEAEVEEASRAFIDYLYGHIESPNTQIVYEGETRPFLNEKELSHMVDCRGLFKLKTAAQWVLWPVWILGTGGLVWGEKKQGRSLAKSLGKVLGQEFLAVLGLMGILCLGLMGGFNRAFILFHKLFFANDLWLLDPKTDLMIRMLPEGYFMDIALRIGMLTAALAVLLGAVALGLTLWGRKQEA